ncbi:YEATS domain-containing protein YAF9 [Sporobolomyces salmoneus]|uniref:YEATS domain-containing protein YAF9 n=1 Tax=Sporobolomyces salmoneus TaxID=183962 RepID=UPI003173DC3A
MSAQTRRVRGVSVYRPIIYGNSTTLLTEQERQGTDHTHRWTVGIRSAASLARLNSHPNHQIGGADDLSYMIKKVTFKLYETYKNPLRTIESPPFEVTETGWGEFDIIIKIFFQPEASEKPLTLNHHLKLHPWPIDPILYAQPSLIQDPSTGAPVPLEPGSQPSLVQPVPILSPVHAWQYEEIIFNEPTELFYSSLLSNPPTPLPPSNRFPLVLTNPLSGGGNIGEFSQEMERNELERLEGGRVRTVNLIGEMKESLVGYEKELNALKKEIEEITAAQQQGGAGGATIG